MKKRNSIHDNAKVFGDMFWTITIIVSLCVLASTCNGQQIDNSRINAPCYIDSLRYAMNKFDSTTNTDSAIFYIRKWNYFIEIIKNKWYISRELNASQGAGITLFPPKPTHNIQIDSNTLLNICKPHIDKP